MKRRRKILPFCSQCSFPSISYILIKTILLVQNSPNKCLSNILFPFSFISFQQYFLVHGISLPFFISFSSLFFYYQPLYLDCSLLTREPVLFRKKRGKVGENEDAGYSRQQTRDILIPTSSPAVVHEWRNVRQLLQLWAWEVSPSILILKARTSMPRTLRTNKTAFNLPLTLPPCLSKLSSPYLFPLLSLLITTLPICLQL